MTERIFWTLEDDARLIAARATGRSWTLVAALVPGRTAAGCATRHRLLMIRAIRKGASVPQASGPPLMRKPQVRRRKAGTEPPPKGAEGLLDATLAYYKREARRRRTTPEAVRLVLNYAPAELRRMAARA